MISEFSHKAVYGLTTCGKTTLVKKRAEIYLQKKQQVIVYAGNGDHSFPKGVLYVYTPDELEFILNSEEYQGAFIIIDEAANLFNRARSPAKYPSIYELTISGRHNGFTVWLISQFPTSIPKYLRRNTGERYLFMQADADDAKAIWEDCSKISYEGRPLKDCLLEIPKYAFFRFNRNTLQLDYFPP